MRLSRSVGFATALVTIAAPIAVAMTAPVAAVASAAHKSKVAVHGDFDGDGKSDVVAGAPGGNRVRVIYTKAKPGGSHAQWINSPAPHIGFGGALAVGDFNGDGFADLAVGAAGLEDSDGDPEGAVYIYSGSKTGLHYHGTMFHGPGEPDLDNAFGASISAGAVNADRFADLAVGNPGPGGGGDSQGSAHLYFGSTAGLSTTGAVFVVSSHPVEEGDFGTAVLLADVNGDGQKDLVVGEPGGGPATADPFHPSGDVQVFYANRTGLGSRHKTILGSTLHAKGSFGTSLASADVNGDAIADVVAAAPFATVNGKALAGKVVVLAGGKHGLKASHRRVFSEASPHIAGGVASKDFFGLSVSAGDLTGDGHAEVIIGAPGAIAHRKPAGGAVYVLRGTKSGVTALHSLRFTQASKRVPGGPISHSQFGFGVGTLRVANGARHDLLVGVPAKHKGGLVLVMQVGASGAISKHARVIKDSRSGDQLGSFFAA